MVVVDEVPEDGPELEVDPPADSLFMASIDDLLAAGKIEEAFDLFDDAVASGRVSEDDLRLAWGKCGLADIVKGQNPEDVALLCGNIVADAARRQIGNA